MGPRRNAAAASDGSASLLGLRFGFAVTHPCTGRAQVVFLLPLDAEGRPHAVAQTLRDAAEAALPEIARKMGLRVSLSLEVRTGPDWAQVTKRES